MEYLILRLLFINPVGLPSMTESYLRKDFHFGMYLAHCYGKVLVKFFKWSLFSLLLLFVLIVILNITFEAIPGEEASVYVSFSLLFICFLVLILLRSCLNSAEKRVTPSVFDEKTDMLRDPENFNVLFNQRPGAVDPFTQYEMLPRLPYLDFDNSNPDLNAIERKQLNNDEERQALLDQSLASARGGGGAQARSLAAQEQEGKLFESGKDPFNVNNRHEALFCCGRKGVNYLIINTAQFFYILTILYLSLKCVTIGPQLQGSL